MPTETGAHIIRILRERISAEEEETERRERVEAEHWANGRAQELVELCRTDAFGTTIELLCFKSREPSRAERAMIDALGKKLGTDLGKVRIDRSVYADEPGTPQFSMQIDLRELLKLLEKS